MLLHHKFRIYWRLVQLILYSNLSIINLILVPEELLIKICTIIIANCFDVIICTSSSEMFMFSGGERGIRTLETLPSTDFRDQRFKPLSHLSSTIIIGILIWKMFTLKIWCIYKQVKKGLPIKVALIGY